MASRNGYTITPSYGGNQRQSQPWSRPHQSAQPGDPRRPAVKSSQKNTNDTFLLAMLFIVAPVCGLLGLPFLLFRWVFIALSTFLIVTIWVTKRFMFQGRAFLSGILVVAAVVSLISAVDEKSMANQNMYTPYYAYNGANPAIGGADQALSAGDQAPAALPTNPIEILPSGATEGENTLAGTQAEDLSAIPDANATPAPQRVMSDAEVILNNYMTLWQNEDFEGMVQFTLPSWRSAQRLPPRQLSYQHNNYTLNSWEITSESLATAIDSATYSVIVNVTKKSSSRETVYGKYSAIVFNSDGAWYVDPDSMRTMLKYEPAPVQDQYAGSGGSQEAAPTPEPTLDPKMKLYYNSDGGKFYHADSQCSTIDPKYYSKIKSFAYSDLGKSGYAKLKPCTKCDAPD